MKRAGRLLTLLGVLSATMLAGGCHSCDRRATATHAAVLPAGRPVQGNALFRVAIYYADQPEQQPATVLRELAKKLTPTLRVGLSPNDTGKIAGVAVLESDIGDAPPPNIESLEYFGRGLSPTEKQKLANAKRVMALAFSAPADQALDIYRSVLVLTGAVAETTKGLLWDESTREAFSIEAWKERSEPSEQSVLDVRHAVTNHAYEKDGMLRIVTLGMEKFGLPDLVVDGVPPAIGERMTTCLYATAQALVEGTKTGEGGSLHLAVDAFKSDSFRRWLTSGVEKGPKREVTVMLTDAKPEEGDPEPLAGIVFPEKPERALHALLGEAASKVADNDRELEAARERAVRRLMDLKPLFQRGLPERQSLSVKAAIGPAGHKEYMWMDLTAWDGEKLRGVLSNEPMEIPDLHKGAVVQVTEKDLFDFLLRRADGEAEGGETTKILKSRER